MSLFNPNPFASIAFKCIQCDRPVALDTRGICCPACHFEIPVRNHTLDFMGPYTRAPHQNEAVKTTCDAVMRALELPESARPEITEAVLASYDRTGIDYIDAEMALLPARFGLDVIGNAPLNKRQRSDAQALTFLSHFIPKTIQRESLVHRSVRFRAGRKLNHTGENRVGLAYEWTKALSGRTFRWPWTLLKRVMRPHITWLPIDVNPGREITIPMAIQTPAEMGAYTLTIYPVGVRSRSKIVLQLEVVDPDNEPAVNAGYGDYGQDHAAAVDYLEGYLSGRPSSTVLEVASGVNPHLLKLAIAGHTVIAGDVCSNLVQLGAIYSRHHLTEDARNHMGFASFDAFCPPFQPHQFDGVAMFSALHHFPDPESFLKKLASLVKPGGFIAVLCEPCDPSSLDDAYLRDLNAGINEQVWTVAEYREIFARAHLKEERLQNDAGSLKAILQVQ